MRHLQRRFPVYGKLLSLYPLPYRKTYGQQMLQTLADMLDARSSKAAQLSVWARLAFDLPLSAASQQVQYLGGIMATETPRFVKRNALISALLLVPFTGAVLANTISTLFYHHTLYLSWAWSMPLLAIWVLWLPRAAAVLALISLIAFFIQRKRGSRAGWLQALSLAQSWPLLATLFVSLFILVLVFGHDSVHCVTGNPIREIQHAGQTWQCIERG